MNLKMDNEIIVHEKNGKISIYIIGGSLSNYTNEDLMKYLERLEPLPENNYYLGIDLNRKPKIFTCEPDGIDAKSNKVILEYTMVGNNERHLRPLYSFKDSLYLNGVRASFKCAKNFEKDQKVTIEDLKRIEEKMNKEWKKFLSKDKQF